MPPSPETQLRQALAKYSSAQVQLRAAIGAASAAGMTQRQIASVLGVSQGRVWRILNTPESE